MKRDKRDYKRIVKELVEKSFVKLEKKIILVHGVNFQVSTAYASITYLGFMVWIVVFPFSKRCTLPEITSILAHELSHYELILNMGFKEKLKFAFRWLFTKKGKAWFEMRADQYAIEKGYARGLYSRVFGIEKKSKNERLKTRLKKGYLSSKEIKEYAKKIGEW